MVTPLMCSSDQGGDDEEGDPVAKAEEDFWNNISQARKDFAAKEKKRAEASGVTKSQPTPIPEEGVEPTTTNEAKPEVYTDGLIAIIVIIINTQVSAPVDDGGGSSEDKENAS